jgi:hypothetical protein
MRPTRASRGAAFQGAEGVSWMSERFLRAVDAILRAKHVFLIGFALPRRWFKMLINVF